KAFLLAVVADDVLQVLDDPAGQLIVLLLQIGLRVFVIALEVAQLASILVLQVAALFLLHDQRLLLQLLLQVVDIVLLLLERALQLVDLPFEFFLGTLAGLGLVERALQVDVADLRRALREGAACQERAYDHPPQKSHELCLLVTSETTPSSPDVYAARRARTSTGSSCRLSHYGGPPNENITVCVSSPTCSLSGKPTSMRSGPIGDSQRNPPPVV